MRCLRLSDSAGTPERPAPTGCETRLDRTALRLGPCGTPRDSLHVIYLIYSQDGGKRPEVIISDTGSYSDVVFGLLRLLGFDYRPQLADLPDTKLWRINPIADYGRLDATARGRIDLARVRRHWPDVLRLVASIHTGAVSAYDAMRMLQAGGTQPSS